MTSTSHAGLGLYRLVFIAVLAMVVSQRLSWAADTNAADADGKNTESVLISNQESLRSFLEIQDQIHNTQMAIERNRQEAETAAASNSQVLEARLARLETSLTAQRLGELDDMKQSNHTVLIASSAFVVAGFIVLLISSTLQWTAVRRLAAAASHAPNAQTLQSLSLSDAQMAATQAVEQSNSRFLSMIERLEQRMQEMEGTSQTAQYLPPQTTDGPALQIVAVNETTVSDENPIALLLGKGQTLLKLDKLDEALECLDEVLAIDPGNTDALIKKGAALERLQRLPEAIACYDLAIAHDNGMTMAYLYKGAVFNRMERYGEALECYEQALKARQKDQAASVIFG